MDVKSLFISAGDPSGDNATSLIAETLLQKNPNLTLFGLGGSRLKKLGQRQLAESDQLAVLGFWEVAKHYLFFRKLFHKCVHEIKENRPGAILLVDYPGFNLRLAKKVKPLGIPIIYYISPQVWAWGKKRLPLIEETVDQMLVILPFEKDFYRDHGVDAQFVGHYLLEDIPSEFIASPSPGDKQLALFPGSRPQEIERMLRPMLVAAKVFCDKHGWSAKVAAVKGLYDYEQICHSTNVKIEYNNAREIIYQSDLLLTSSGSATLEAGIIGRPMVVIYKTGFITYHIAKKLIKLDSIALVNLVIGRKLIPELIQADATPANMVEKLDMYLADKDYYQMTKKHLDKLPDILGGVGASQRISQIVGEYL